MYCYKKIDIKAILNMARNHCETDGGDLATIHNEEERQYFLNTTYHDYWFGYRKFGKSNSGM